MRYIAPEDDDLTFKNVSDALEKYGIERHKVRYLLRYGSRSTIYQIGKAANMTRQQVRSYLKHLTNTHPEFHKKAKLRQ